MSSAAYQPVSLPEGLSREDEEFQDEPHHPSGMDPLEMETESADARDNRSSEAVLLRQVRDRVVWPHLALAVTTWLVCPALVLGMVLAYQVTGQIWACALCALHLNLATIKARCHMNELARPDPATDAKSFSNTLPSSSYSDNADQAKEGNDDDTREEDANASPGENSGRPPSKGCIYFWSTTVPSLLDILLFGGIYPIVRLFFNGFFVDADGTLVYDWINYYHAATAFGIMGWIIVASRLCFGGRMLLVSIPASTYYLTTTYYLCQNLPVVGTCWRICYYRLWVRFKICFSSPPRPLICWKLITLASACLSTLFLVYSIHSVVVHFGPNSPIPPALNATFCDPLDATECCLPFPSNYLLKADPTTDTGYRVDLKPESFPTLKGRLPISMDFLNRLDGFSTMGPLLFYMEGMKESHEKYVHAIRKGQLIQKEPGVTRLRGHEEMDLSVTPYSTTLLLDVDEQVLVAHSAEIDYLDPERPLVMVFPAKPLKHNTHYALVVINATDADGNRLPPTTGMTELWEQETNRTKSFVGTILPALERATHKSSIKNVTWGGPFGSFSRKKDPAALQLMFDFQTVSKKSQLGPVRAVRDAVLQHISRRDWKWADHARLIRQVEGNCENPEYPLARTIHGELDVPWFLSKFGPGYREATLDSQAVETKVATTIGKAKFLIHIPCSLKRKALDGENSTAAQSLRAVVEYGHGLFFDREEAGDAYLIKMANRNGYVIMAMDWRGMSRYDYPIVLRTMLADPTLFASIRDNLIQGYGNKFALQHFANNGMLDREWFQFTDSNGVATIPHSIEPGKGKLPSVFYGISQGGILGAGYMGLSGASGLITRGVLGVPGSPFSLVLSRSLQFLGYDAALLMNFYNNRDIRIFLNLAQMCWDSVEGSGVLGQPIDEPFPPVLLQAGLGDAIVPSLAAERLARALGAQTLPFNPRGPIFGIPEGQPSDHNQTGPHAVLTEMLYQEDYENLPADDELTQPWNGVHDCVRMEPALQHQIEVFFNEGRVTNPCGGDLTCVRKKAYC